MYTNYDVNSYVSPLLEKFRREADKKSLLAKRKRVLENIEWARDTLDREGHWIPKQEVLALKRKQSVYQSKLVEIESMLSAKHCWIP